MMYPGGCEVCGHPPGSHNMLVHAMREAHMTKLHPLEADVKDAVKKLLTQYEWFWFSPPANMYGTNGISDILAIRRGHFLAVEVKLKKKFGTAGQEAWMEKIRDHGGTTMVVHMGNIPDFQALLERLAFEMGPG